MTASAASIHRRCHNSQSGGSRKASNEKPSRMNAASAASLHARLPAGCMTIHDAIGHYPFSEPLVDGIASAWRGSRSSAVRSTRATALKQVSAIW